MEKPFCSWLPAVLLLLPGEGGRQSHRGLGYSLPAKAASLPAAELHRGKGWCWQQLPLGLHRFLL